MSDILLVHHDLKRDLHNILFLLKSIQADEVIADPELKSMLDLAVERENKIMFSLNSLLGSNKEKQSGANHA